MGEPATKLNQEEKQCPACAETILAEAKKCKHCGEDLSGSGRVVQKQVGVIFAALILLFPYIFSWFTLRKGYSAKARVIALVWLAAVFAIANPFKTGSPSKPLNKNATQVAKPKPAKNEVTNKKAQPKADNFGIWAISYYVDEFGAPTRDGFITNSNYIKGSFSNSAVNDAKLNVRLLLNNYKSIRIKLFEYAGTNPVKAYGNKLYRIVVRDKNGNKYELKGTNYKSESIFLSKDSAKKLHSILKLGGEVSFYLHEAKYVNNSYRFSISNSGKYYAAYKKLHNM